MSVEVNVWAVLLAALSSMVVGMIWYSPMGFYKQWVSLARIKGDPSKMTSSQKAFLYGSVFVASLVTAYVLAHVYYLSHVFFKNSSLQDALTTAFWLWLGFTAARLYVHDVFEGRRKKLSVLTASHELVTLLVMALIIGAIGY